MRKWPQTETGSQTGAFTLVVFRKSLEPYLTLPSTVTGWSGFLVSRPHDAPFSNTREALSRWHDKDVRVQFFYLFTSRSRLERGKVGSTLL